MPDERWNELFAAMRSNRDRAILALGISNAARAAELLGVRGVDLDWGEQARPGRPQGQRREQWLPASPEAFVWIRLYLAELGARWHRTSRCGGRCAAATAATGCGVSR